MSAVYGRAGSNAKMIIVEVEAIEYLGHKFEFRNHDSSKTNEYWVCKNCNFYIYLPYSRAGRRNFYIPFEFGGIPTCQEWQMRRALI
jgi:hypothetical protein